MTATPAEAPPAGNGATAGSEDDLREAERDVLELKRAEIAAELPEHLQVGDDLEITYAEGWQQCPLCIGLGAVEPKFPQSGKHMACPDCVGMGEVMTGSLVQGSDHLMCDTCMGKGFLLKEEWANEERRRREAESGRS